MKGGHLLWGGVDGPRHVQTGDLWGGMGRRSRVGWARAWLGLLFGLGWSTVFGIHLWGILQLSTKEKCE